MKPIRVHVKLQDGDGYTFGDVQDDNLNQWTRMDYESMEIHLDGVRWRVRSVEIDKVDTVQDLYKVVVRCLHVPPSRRLYDLAKISAAIVEV